jgi:GR25 family glycosyltransferase involved in LPS biosynthesis
MNLQEVLAEFLGRARVGVGIIHLAHAKEREPAIAQLEAALQQPLQRFHTVDGAAAIAAGHPTICATEPNKIRTAGEIGCLLSHIGIARAGIAQDWTHMLVFEDDCIPAEGFSLEKLRDYLRRAKAFSHEFSMKGTDEFILFGTCGCYSWKFLTEGVKATNNFNGSHCYLMGRPMMEKLVGSYDYLLKNGVVVPVDGLIGLLLRTQGRWALCSEDERGLFLQNRNIPSYILGDGPILRKE